MTQKKKGKTQKCSCDSLPFRRTHPSCRQESCGADALSRISLPESCSTCSGVRGDHRSLCSSSFSPVLTQIYRPAPSWVCLRVIHARRLEYAGSKTLGGLAALLCTALRFRRNRGQKTDGEAPRPAGKVTKWNNYRRDREEQRRPLSLASPCELQCLHLLVNQQHSLCCWNTVRFVTHDSPGPDSEELSGEKKRQTRGDPGCKLYQSNSHSAAALRSCLCSSVCCVCCGVSRVFLRAELMISW